MDVISGKSARRHGQQLREQLAVDAAAQGHRLSPFKPYKSHPEKFTAFCRRCGKFVIQYDTPPAGLPAVSGAPLTERCTQEA